MPAKVISISEHPDYVMKSSVSKEFTFTTADFYYIGGITLLLVMSAFIYMINSL